MKTASLALRAILDRSQFYMADLFQIQLLDGSVLRLTSAPSVLAWDGQVFTPAAVERGTVRLIRGIEVDTLDVTIHEAASIAVNSSTLARVAVNGGLDGARLSLRRAVMETWGDTSAGLVHLFDGRIANVHIDRMAAQLSVVSDTELLDVKLPRRLYQPGCTHALYGLGCGLDAATWTTSCIIQAGSTTSEIVVDAITSRPFGYFVGGVATFAGGDLTGVRRTIKLHDAADRVHLMTPLPIVPAIGTQVLLRPGCDKTRGMCKDRFSNELNFGGFPYVPKPETLL